MNKIRSRSSCIGLLIGHWLRKINARIRLRCYFGHTGMRDFPIRSKFAPREGDLRNHRCGSAIVTKHGIRTGTVTIFAQHTSCSLVVMENAAPAARRDLESFSTGWCRRMGMRSSTTKKGRTTCLRISGWSLTRTSETVPHCRTDPIGNLAGDFPVRAPACAPHRETGATIIGE